MTKEERDEILNRQLTAEQVGKHIEEINTPSPAEPAKESQPHPEDVKEVEKYIYQVLLYKMVIAAGKRENSFVVKGHEIAAKHLAEWMTGFWSAMDEGSAQWESDCKDAQREVALLKKTYNQLFDAYKELQAEKTSPAPHPEPSEQSQGAFLEWLDKLISAANKRFYKADTEDSEIGAAATCTALESVREKYLSLHAQPKGEVEEENELSKTKELLSEALNHITRFGYKKGYLPGDYEFVVKADQYLKSLPAEPLPPPSVKPNESPLIEMLKAREKSVARFANQFPYWEGSRDTFRWLINHLEGETIDNFPGNHLPDIHVGDIPQPSESQPSVKPEREETQAAAAISSAALGSYLQDHPEDRWAQPSPTEQEGESDTPSDECVIKTLIEANTDLQSQLSAVQTEAQQYRDLIKDIAKGAWDVSEGLASTAHLLLDKYPSLQTPQNNEPQQ